jgi:hypothetical protein
MYDTLILKSLAEREKSAYLLGDSEKSDLYALLIELCKDNDENADIVETSLFFRPSTC